MNQSRTFLTLCKRIGAAGPGERSGCQKDARTPGTSTVEEEEGEVGSQTREGPEATCILIERGLEILEFWKKYFAKS